MIDKSIRDKREKLRSESIRLKELFFENDVLDFKIY